MQIFLNTTVPFFLLVALGFFSRRLNLIEQAGVKTLSSYVYYFALPALFFINLSELQFDKELLSYLAACLLPIVAIVLILLLLRAILRFSQETLYLLLFCSILGNYAFLGIPFAIFAFHSPEAEYYASVAASILAFTSFAIGLVILELHSVKHASLSFGAALGHVAKKLVHNPLIISISLGLIVALIGVKIPLPIRKPIHMLGSTTSTVAIFMLGAFFFGRTYDRIKLGLALSLIRIVAMPLLALGSIALVPLSDLEGSIVVIMHGMPLAIASVVLAERYQFHVHIVTSLILITSLISIFSLNLWLLLF